MRVQNGPKANIVTFHKDKNVFIEHFHKVEIGGLTMYLLKIRMYS